MHLDAALYRELLAVADPEARSLLQRWVCTSKDGPARIREPR